MCHALATGTLGFGIARTALGFGEAGNFPAAIKAVAEWFPKKDRALATGIFQQRNQYGCHHRSAADRLDFYSIMDGRKRFSGPVRLGFIWLIFWWWLVLRFHSKQKKVTAEEYRIYPQRSGRRLTDDNVERHADGRDYSGYRQTWAIILGKFLTDPVWWFYLFWIPSYFNTTYHLNLTRSAIHVSRFIL